MDEPASGEAGTKRRASLRLEEAAEKKVRGDLHAFGQHLQHVGRSKEGTTAGGTYDTDPADSQEPSTADSTRYAPPSNSSYSSPSSSTGEDYPHPSSAKRREAQGKRRTSIGRPHSSSLHPPSLAPPPWQSDETVIHPPPSFNLSTGQPLVNPPLKTQAAFVGKLYAMLEDDDIAKTGLIHWSSDGTIFTCPNPTEFSKAVLPRFYKHNNWQSFVRQLNMYSFNKVNDLFATTTDPLAWEFRHPLFQRGKPHLLASIKRKTTRPSHAETSSSLISPTDEESKPVAGWMRSPVSHSAAPPSSSSTSSQQVHEDARRAAAASRQSPPASRGYGYTTRDQSGETGPPRSSDDARAYWDTTRSVPPPQSSSSSSSASRLAYPPPITDSARFLLPDPSRLPLRTAPASHPPPPIPSQATGYPESQYHHPLSAQHSPVETLAQSVATLEDRLQRLTDVLHSERIQHTRAHLDLVSYFLQISDWVTAPQRPSQSDVRALRTTLERFGGDLKQKYETLMASDTLAGFATAPGALPRDRMRQYDPTLSSSLTNQTQQQQHQHQHQQAQTTTRSMPNPSLPDSRRSALPSPGPPRSSPLTSYFPDTTSVRLGSSAETSTSTSVPPPPPPFATSPLTFNSASRPPGQRLEGGRVGESEVRAEEGTMSADEKPKGLRSLLN